MSVEFKKITAKLTAVLVIYGGILIAPAEIQASRQNICLPAVGMPKYSIPVVYSPVKRVYKRKKTKDQVNKTRVPHAISVHEYTMPIGPAFPVRPHAPSDTVRVPKGYRYVLCDGDCCPIVKNSGCLCYFHQGYYYPVCYC